MFKKNSNTSNHQTKHENIVKRKRFKRKIESDETLNQTTRSKLTSYLFPNIFFVVYIVLEHHEIDCLKSGSRLT